ncbi:hypothetical protein BSLG_003808 [Batrachochytrium salamandrivorans]|nr:hypothetical protein BSLG_003808 [Batrachochytrium salamandrivorans]
MSRSLEALARWALPIGIIASGAQASMYNVEGGHRAVIFDRLRGVMPTPVGEGTHFLIPWLQRAIMFEVRTKPRTISTTTGSKDMQTISLSLRVLHRPEYSRLNVIYQNLGMDYDERVLPSIGNEVLKAIVAQFDAGELITQREITHLTFGKDFTAAVEQKVIAQQEAERARFVVEKAEQEKLAGIIRAEGESQAARLVSDAYKKSGQAHLELRRIEASKEIAATLSNSKNVTYLPSSRSGSSNMLLKIE